MTECPLILLPPSPVIDSLHRLMLTLLLDEAETFDEAWSLWQEQVDMENLDYAAFRLIPMLYHRVKEDAKGKSRHMARMKGIYRYFYYRNQMLLASVGRAVQALHDHGIEVMLFKGAACALRYYDSIALRPMGDVDMLIRPHQVKEAEAVLEQQGWKKRYQAQEAVQVIHSCDYVDEQKNGLDLHGYALLESLDEKQDERIWDRSEAFFWNGCPVRIMGPEDLVLMGCINGQRDGDSVRLDWIMDVMVIAHQKNLDWSVVLREASQRHLEETLYESLALIHSLPGHLVDEAVLVQIIKKEERYGRLWYRLVSEHRTDTMGEKDRLIVNRLLGAQAGFDAKAIAAQDDLFFYRQAAADKSGAKYMHLKRAPDGSLRSIYLHRTKRWLLFRALSGARGWLFLRLLFWRPALEGNLMVPVGFLRPTDKLPRRAYQAQIELDAMCPDVLYGRPEETVSFKVTVRNTSNHYWWEHQDATSCFGLSGHIQREQGDWMVWDLPRVPLMHQLPEHLVFFGPGQTADLSFSIQLPSRPGRYVLWLDLVHEQKTWFSKRGNNFPTRLLIVSESCIG